MLRIKFGSLGQIEPWVKRLQESGLEVSTKNFDESVRLILTPKAFDENKQLLTELLQQAVREYEAS